MLHRRTSRLKQKQARSNLPSRLCKANSAPPVSTLGSYLSHVNPHTTALRNCKRVDIKPIWVGRAMFEEEFDRIWTAQSSYYPSISTPDFKRQVERLLFWQRKVSAGKPGRCALEENEIRAPRSSLLAKHFRLLQTLNNIKLRETSLSPQWRLARTERDLLLSALSKAIHVAKGSKQKESYGLTFTELKKHLGLQQRTAKVNLEDGDESTFLLGNRTNAIMSCAFGPERWNAMDERQQRRIVRKWITEHSPKRLKDIAREQWGLNEASAEKLASLEPEDGYAALSHKAMLRLLPFMTDEMLTYPEALERAGYTNRTSGKKALDYLPPVDTALPQIPNPVVKRTLSELRAVLNERYANTESLYRFALNWLAISSAMPSNVRDFRESKRTTPWSALRLERCWRGLVSGLRNLRSRKCSSTAAPKMQNASIAANRSVALKQSFNPIREFRSRTCYRNAARQLDGQ